MKWRDFLYFSKGERRALTLLLVLITISFILLIWTENRQVSNPYHTRQSASKTNYSEDSLNAVLKTHPAVADISIMQEKSNPHPETKKNTFERKPTLSYSNYPRAEKYPVGTIIELNTADTTILKKVPGIGSTYARRIIRYRNLLGGFYSVSQLSEVYGIDDAKYQELSSWFKADSSAIKKLYINTLPVDSLRKHPYLTNRQVRTLDNIRKRKATIDRWESIHLLEEFNETDLQRLKYYISFN